MSSGKKDSPKAPDYTGAAEKQGESSLANINAQTAANRPNQNTPWGSSTWTQDPSAGGGWTQNVTLTPQQQSALDSQTALQEGRSGLASGLLGRAQSEFGQPVDWNKFQAAGGTPDVPQYGQGLGAYGSGPQQSQYNPEGIQRGLDTQGLQGVDSGSKYYGQAGDAIYNQFASRADPRFARDTAGLDTQLRNQGLRPGDEAYDYAQQQQRQSQNDAYQQAAYQATIGSGQEAQRMQGMDMGLRGQQFGERQAGGNFANQASQQALAQQLGIGQANYGQSLGASQYANALRGQQNQEQLAQGGQQFQQGMAASQYQTQQRQQQIAEEMQKRGFSLNEINAIITGQQVQNPNMPQFSQAGAAQPTNYLGAAGLQGQYNTDQFNSQQMGLQGMMSGLSSLGAAGIGQWG